MKEFFLYHVSVLGYAQFWTTPFSAYPKSSLVVAKIFSEPKEVWLRNFGQQGGVHKTGFPLEMVLNITQNDIVPHST